MTVFTHKLSDPGCGVQLSRLCTAHRRGCEWYPGVLQCTALLPARAAQTAEDEEASRQLLRSRTCGLDIHMCPSSQHRAWQGEGTQDLLLTEMRQGRRDLGGIAATILLPTQVKGYT